jgi:hypothetical protein
MLRPVLLVLPIAAAFTLLAPAPGEAQRRGAAQGAGQQCDRSEPAQRRRSVLGGIAGGIAGAALGRSGVPTGIIGIGIPVSSLLSEAIMALLDCKEQEQAAKATDDAIRGGVGTTATWTSETRPNVSGTSSATGEERLADGTHCMTVTDIIIVDGEETRAPKRMCRGPGDRGYARV